MKSFLLIFSLLLTQAFHAQNDNLKNRRDSAITVFIDCNNTFCDQVYIKQEIPWVNYVRDRKLAQVHLLISSQSTAGNGDQFLFDFIGLNELQSMSFQLSYYASTNQTSDEIREGIVSKIKMGLMPFVSNSDLSDDFEISYNYSTEIKEETVEDKWKSWVVDINTDAWFNGQESSRSISNWNNISTLKITDDWKYVFGFYNSFNDNRFKYNGEWIISTQTSNSFDGKVVKSLNEKLSIAGFADVNSSTYGNYDFSTSLFGGIEYNIFPYSESAKRLLRMNYLVGARFNDYTETTVFNKNVETLFKHKVNLVLKLIQEWGSVSTSLYAENYLHDFKLYNVGANSNLRIRIVKGLSLNLNGGISFINDQINLPKGEITLEETLLRQRQLSTNIQYYGNIGLSYTFGSIYNNIVNPRFGFD